MNSAVLCVASVRWLARVMVAIIKSLGPIGVPRQGISQLVFPLLRALEIALPSAGGRLQEFQIVLT